MAPRDVSCEDFAITYPRIAAENNAANNESDVDQTVDQAIENFLRNLSQIGPELMSGYLTLSFFERRASRQLFGLVSHEERVIWEQWVLRVVVNNTPRPLNNDSAAVIERQRIQDTAERMLRAVLAKVFEIAGGSIEHVPPVMYEFEIHSAKRADDRENVYARVTNMPPILNLSS